MVQKAQKTEFVCRNRKATFRFEILEHIECGIILLGSEVKSLREKAVSLEEAYARIESDGVWLVGCHIAPYLQAHAQNHEPLRKRKLLLHSSQLRKLRPKLEQKGFTLTPLSVYFNERGIAKVDIALAKGKNVRDKRETLKKRETSREIEREIRKRR